MTNGLKPYPAYKDSGVSWLGQVPEHWELRSLRASANVEKGRLPRSLVERGRQPEGSAPYLSMNYLRSIGESPFEYATYQPDLVLVDRGETILLWDGANAGEFLKAKSGAVSSTAARVRPRAVDQQFFFYACQQVERTLRALTVGMGIPHVDGDVLKGLSVVIPPETEQSAIVRYLDHADRKVRHAIRARQQLIKLLTEQKQAIIQRAVTRGLDPSVRLKPSGVSWLGDVPEHWEIRRAKQVARILRGRFTYRPRNDPSLYDGAYPFIQTGLISRVGKFITSYEQTLNERGLAVSKLFPAGTLVMTIAANIGDIAVLTFDACFPDSVVGLMPHELMGRDYLYLVLLCMKPELLREAPVNTQGNLNVERIGAMSLPCPPISEQSAVVQYVDGATANLDKGIDAAHREIDLLREYRTRLIADVVTGKLDVRDAVATLPENMDETEQERGRAEDTLGDSEELCADEQSADGEPDGGNSG